MCTSILITYDVVLKNWTRFNESKIYCMQYSMAVKDAFGRLLPNESIHIGNSASRAVF